MLQKLNEQIQGVIAWVVIILIAVTFGLFGIDYYVQSRQDSGNQVEVNGDSIARQEVEINYRRARQMRDPSTLSATNEKELKKQILDEMIINRVSLQAARKYGFDVSASLANAAILSIPQFQEDGHFSTERYQQALSGALFTPETFNQEVQQGMLLNQQRFAFIGTSFVLPNEVERFVKLYMQTRDYKYLVIPSSLFLNEVSVSEQEITNYYNEHKGSFIAPEEVSIAYLELSMPDVKKDISVSEEHLRQYYEENKNNFLTSAQWRVAHILFSVPPGASTEEKESIKAKADNTAQELQAKPELFMQKAKTLSDDKISANKGGVLPWIAADQSELGKYLLNLTKPNQISNPVATKHGFEIFKLIEYKPSLIKPFNQVKSDIREQLIAEKVQAAFAVKLEQLSDLTYQSPDSLESAADALNLRIQKSESFTRSGGSTPLTKDAQVIQAAFSHDVLELDNNSEAIQIDNNKVIILRVNQHLKAQTKSLADVKADIRSQITGNKAKEKAAALGKAIKEANQEEATLLINKHDLHWKSEEQVTRDAEKAPAAINALAYNLAKKGAVGGVSLHNGDFALVSLTSIHDGNVSQLDNEQLTSIALQLESSYGIMDYDLYIGSLMKKAEVVHHD